MSTELGYVDLHSDNVKSGIRLIYKSFQKKETKPKALIIFEKKCFMPDQRNNVPKYFTIFMDVYKGGGGSRPPIEALAGLQIVDSRGTASPLNIYDLFVF